MAEAPLQLECEKAIESFNLNKITRDTVKGSQTLAKDPAVVVAEKIAPTDDPLEAAAESCNPMESGFGISCSFAHKCFCDSTRYF